MIFSCTSWFPGKPRQRTSTAPKTTLKLSSVIEAATNAGVGVEVSTQNERDSSVHVGTPSATLRRDVAP